MTAMNEDDGQFGATVPNTNAFRLIAIADRKQLTQGTGGTSYACHFCSSWLTLRGSVE